MRIIRKISYVSAASSAIALLVARPVLAVCPICTVAVGAGLGLTQWFGIDDAISGVWIGGMIVSIGYWTDGWLERRGIRWHGRLSSVIAVWVALTYVPLWFAGIVGHPFNTLWGIDKIALGSLAGAIGFVAATQINELLKRRNGGRVHFPFQKVVLPVVMLALLTVLFYCLTC